MVSIIFIFFIQINNINSQLFILVKNLKNYLLMCFKSIYILSRLEKYLKCTCIYNRTLDSSKFKNLTCSPPSLPNYPSENLSRVYMTHYYS